MNRPWPVLAVLVVSASLAGAADNQTKLITRIDTVTVAKHGNSLSFKAEGKATTPGMSAGPAKIVRHENASAPDKEGFLEYDMLYDAPRDYTGFKMRTVRASYKERDVPAEVKGVRIFFEFGKYDALIPIKPVKAKKNG
jgi:hypothetical protein